MGAAAAMAWAAAAAAGEGGEGGLVGGCGNGVICFVRTSSKCPQLRAFEI